MYLAKKNTKKPFFMCFLFFPKFDGSWKMKGLMGLVMFLVVPPNHTFAFFKNLFSWIKHNFLTSIINNINIWKGFWEGWWTNLILRQWKKKDDGFEPKNLKNLWRSHGRTWIMEFGIWILDFGFWILDFVTSMKEKSHKNIANVGLK